MANELFAGSQAVLYAAKEATYGTPRSLSGAMAMRTLSERLSGAEEREVRPDRSGNSDHLERYVGRKSADFEVTKLILPNGAGYVEPDDGVLWEAAFGHASLGSTSIEYIQATAHTTSLTLRRGIRAGTTNEGELQEHVLGAIVNAVEVSWGARGNNGLAQVVFRGQGKEYGWTGNASLHSRKAPSDPIFATAPAVTLSSVAANIGQFSRGSIVKILKRDTPAGPGYTWNTGGGSGIVVSTLNQTTNRMTFLQALGATLGANGATVMPYNPAPITAGSPLHARIGALSLDGFTSSIDHLGGVVTFEDNRTLLNEEVGYDSASRVLRNDRRNVTFSLDFILRKDKVSALLGAMLKRTAQNIHVHIGDQTYKKMYIVMKNCEFDYVPIDVPDQQMVRIAMTGRALGTVGNDSLKVRFL